MSSLFTTLFTSSFLFITLLLVVTTCLLVLIELSLSLSESESESESEQALFNLASFSLELFPLSNFTGMNYRLV